MRWFSQKEKPPLRVYLNICALARVNRISNEQRGYTKTRRTFWFAAANESDATAELMLAWRRENHLLGKSTSVNGKCVGSSSWIQLRYELVVLTQIKIVMHIFMDDVSRRVNESFEFLWKLETLKLYFRVIYKKTY